MEVAVDDAENARIVVRMVVSAIVVSLSWDGLRVVYAEGRVTMCVIEG